MLDVLTVIVRYLINPAAETARIDAQRKKTELRASAILSGSLSDKKTAELEEALGTSLSAVRRGRDRIHARRAAFDPVDLRNNSDADEDIFDLIVD